MTYDIEMLPVSRDGSELLRVEGLVKKYGETVVVRGVNLAVHERQKICILGPSGSGKTTLLRSLNGLAVPNSGELYYRSEAMFRWPEDQQRSRRHYEQKMRDHRKRFAMVFQQFELFPHLTALANISLAPRRVLGICREEATEDASRFLEKVGLAAFADRHPSQLSGGQQQRVAIARALAMRPEAILFDEPTSALDPEMAHDVTQLMAQLADEGQTMIAVTHNVGMAREIADQVIVMDGGRIIESGSPEAIFEAPEHERTKDILRLREDA